ncbi:apolipoprotein D-like [Tetranychus urticae]|uniref:apolipoprotein D-like n=1 Tax=Tetranychus urticae TaxID=32264 RepID=UPI000D650C77|nr:apolipoprotein D-like [Tetranychus urticae]
MKMIVTLFVVFAFASSAFGFTCPVPETTPGADIGKIAGQWYVIRGIIISSTTNSTMTFTPREDVDFEIKWPGSTSTGEKYVAYGRRTDNQNLLNIYFNVSKDAPIILSFNVVATDYDNYLAAYVCWLGENEFLFDKLILSRSNTLNADKVAELDALLTDKVGNFLDQLFKKTKYY